MMVPEDKIEQTAEIVNSYPGVTHNYQRNADYNMWFALIAENKPILRITIITEIQLFFS